MVVIGYFHTTLALAVVQIPQLAISRTGIRQLSFLDFSQCTCTGKTAYYFGDNHYNHEYDDDDLVEVFFLIKEPYMDDVNDDSHDDVDDK